MHSRNSARGSERAHEMRRRIALEAARLMSEHGIRDFHLAKRKAAQRLGIADDLNLPKNSEIETALREHQRLFQADEQPQRLRRLREVARDAMKFFARFEPRLVGAVLEGTADRHSAVCLHLFSDASEDVAAFLHDEGIPYEEQNRRLRMNAEEQREFPVLLFSADDVAIDLTVLPRDAVRQAPLDRIGERPMRRATIAMLEQLLAESA
ncbi:MAG TPA: hypothetical protein VFB32_14765 [Rudaea sp.]|nr:hypothetical protein [Rudaea sp.]